jgi:hypothetical protein
MQLGRDRRVSRVGHQAQQWLQAEKLRRLRELLGSKTGSKYIPLIQELYVSDEKCRDADDEPHTFRICHVRAFARVVCGAIDVLGSPPFTHHSVFE